MESLEQLSFIVWVRESGSLWGFATFLFMHTIGLATLAGVNASIDLRLLGFAPKLPLAPLRKLFPLMWTALALTASSGVVLLLTDLDPVTAFSAVIASVNCMGPGLGSVGPASNYAVLTDFQVWVCTLAMLLGRLEILSFMALLTPAFWRR